AYDQDSDCAVLYDPGLPPSIGLTETQREIVAGSEWVGVTIGPLIVNDQILDLLREEQKLAWIVKNDPRAITPAQSAALYERADLVFCNGRERACLEEARAAGRTARAGQIIVETQGRRGALFLRGNETRFVAAEPV